MSYSQSDLSIFATTTYYSGDKSDVNNTPQYSDNINAENVNGVTIDCIFKEISGITGTDNLYVNIYTRRNNIWTGNEILLRTVDCGKGSSSDKIKTFFIYTKRAKANYRLSVFASGTTNVFGVQQIIRTWN